MSPRLRELVRQSGVDDPDFSIEDWDNIPLTKFAHLIILECADIADKAEPYKANDLIRKHFEFEA
jgi:hypothetical protein